jgi:hypothetical protein
MFLKTKKAQKIQKRTWYGITATVIIESAFIHSAGLGPLLIPHPSVVNWLLRLTLTEKNRETLTFIHEFEHLQSVPFYMLYTAGMLALAFSKGHSGLTEIFFVLVSSQAGWEIISEFLTFYKNKSLYRRAYNKTAMFPRIVFWSSAVAFAIAGWLMILF